MDSKNYEVSTAFTFESDQIVCTATAVRSGQVLTTQRVQMDWAVADDMERFSPILGSAKAEMETLARSILRQKVNTIDGTG